MVEKKDLKQGLHYKVGGKGNDIFKKGEWVLYLRQEGLSYIFRQGSVDVVINEPGLEKFLRDMDFSEERP